MSENIKANETHLREGFLYIDEELVCQQFKRQPVVYFWVCGAQVKIGFTGDLRRRLYQIRNTCPPESYLVGVVRGDMALEKELHNKFEKYHITREWFCLSNEIKEFIQSVRTNPMGVLPKSKGELIKEGIVSAVASGKNWGRPKRRNDQLILDLRKQGRSLREIANEVGVSLRTVQNAIYDDRDAV